MHSPSDVGETHELSLPEAPPELTGPVKAWRGEIVIPTYCPERPDRNPMFLEKRVYQGSSGRVYPLPFIDRIATEPRSRSWKAVHLENEYLRLMILPEIGGRIHLGRDKTNGYDFFYRQDVIKPALVGLAGPWISGGVEFNWPQHHRPATFLPVATEIEQHEDGSVTVWSSDHDPMLRMKGMHGICLHPGHAAVELKVRLFNRTELPQTFLWWANVAARVHEHYQSFFPPDVRYVADHARRAVTTFPRSTGSYYGIDYRERGRSDVPGEEQPRMFSPDGSYPANDLSWYANIPVPTSYMVTGTEQDFFGGYDHQERAGVVHVANHHISPGKKQWTWGNHEFGYAWDRSLTDSCGPYIELMAGVYTDNQPDFSYLAPWETKTFTQRWFPIREIGIPKAANAESALSLSVKAQRARLGVCVTRLMKDAVITLHRDGEELARWSGDIRVEEPRVLEIDLPEGLSTDALRAAVTVSGQTLIAFDPQAVRPAQPPLVAEEPAPPDQIASVEELYLTGVHLEQYRHATRRPELYWQEALRRDPGESRVHNALGRWRLRRGELPRAAEHFEAAILRLTRLNPNPYDGEPHYNLGLVRRYQGREKEAYDALYKSTWNAAWRGPAYFALAEIDSRRGNWETALDHLERSLRAEAENLNALNLMARLFRKLDRYEEADRVLEKILALDPLDIGARWQRGIAPATGHERLDLAFDLLRSGEDSEAIRILTGAELDAEDGSAPMILLALSSLESRLGLPEADETYGRAREIRLDYCFPSRLDEMLVLESTIALHPEDGIASYLLGNFLYDRRRHEEAIEAWEKALDQTPSFPTSWRNLGIAYFNHGHDTSRALNAFDRAFYLDKSDGRVLYERDQLWKRIGCSSERRLGELLCYPALVEARDDLSVELATLYNQVGSPEKALHLLLLRKFQPWEGGEGLVLAQYVRARMLLGQRALGENDLDRAVAEFEATLEVPENLSEARHLLSNQSDIYFWLGVALERRGDRDQARQWWHRATRSKGDFQQMAVKNISEMTYWSGLSYRRLGEEDQAIALFDQIRRYADELERREPKIDYFATSLPTMLLFDEDLGRRNRIEALYLRAQALAGLGHYGDAEAEIERLLREDGNHSGALDLRIDIRTAGRTAL